MRIAKTITEARRPRAGPSEADVREWIELRRLFQEGRVQEGIERAFASLDRGGGPIMELAKHCAENGRPALALELLTIIGHVRPDLIAALGEGRSFRALIDDPRFLQMIGRL